MVFPWGGRQGLQEKRLWLQEGTPQDGCCSAPAPAGCPAGHVGAWRCETAPVQGGSGLPGPIPVVVVCLRGGQADESRPPSLAA